MSLINVTLPDGTVNEYAAGITCAEVITDALGRKHGCLAARIDGEECDLSRTIENDCSVEGAAPFIPHIVYLNKEKKTQTANAAPRKRETTRLLNPKALDLKRARQRGKTNSISIQ